MQPIIGVTSWRRMVTSSAGETRSHVVYTNYTTMIREAGGVPIVLTPGSETEVDILLEHIDGLLLAGGGDIAPGRYGGMAHEAIYEVDPLRDESELALARAARDRLLPTLAICRGMQVANVAFGGTLFEDIGSHYPDALEHRRHGAACFEPQHGVELDPESTTSAAFGKDMVEVNTVHHQSVRQLGSEFRVTGRAPDGIIEAIEPTDTSWPMWGVQWHPEFLGVGDEPSMSLFRTFVAAASRP